MTRIRLAGDLSPRTEGGAPLPVLPGERSIHCAPWADRATFCSMCNREPIRKGVRVWAGDRKFTDQKFHIICGRCVRKMAGAT